MVQLKLYQILLLIVIVAVLIWYFISNGGLDRKSSTMDLKLEEQEFEGGWLRGKTNQFRNETNYISMLTYNIWFGEFQMRERMKGIGQIIAELKPNIITLNEVTTKNLFLLRSEDWFNRYKLVPTDQNTGESYFVVALSNLIIKSWKVYPFDNSSMGRKLLIVELRVPDLSGSADIPLTIATSHLESLDFNTKKREWQLKKSIEMLSISNNTCLMGDLNLEQKVDGEVILPLPWFDAWLSLTGNSHENGYTWDPTINNMVKDGSAKDRFDRVFCKLSDFAVHSMKVVGDKQLSPGVFPSDHFGLFTVLVPMTKPASYGNLITHTTRTGDVVFKRPSNW